LRIGEGCFNPHDIIKMSFNDEKTVRKIRVKKINPPLIHHPYIVIKPVSRTYIRKTRTNIIETTITNLEPGVKKDKNAPMVMTIKAPEKKIVKKMEKIVPVLISLEEQAEKIIKELEVSQRFIKSIPESSRVSERVDRVKLAILRQEIEYHIDKAKRLSILHDYLKTMM